ncbi:uncharacterized protein PGTG_07725 [Puccinia graminis f. sp. tritici CRL 75-36-700-3]|uniref:Uncharacterized protein n=1 Tax=Puccinia graminis f. sp. tritici (strain CRL 75-36-700-3 / race SCCL) TaxID=418459 RepID=E3KBH0_PUCGT|nr:uncharacterized protein PGTG_07725 [Puccinia graminis f. sp. tritici CRL 75-36-700-3]EFP81476.1 hypothetical protein PGTG_07725 [Puccinia graminis f. sp. tritici CRL 75-36-700-3]
MSNELSLPKDADDVAEVTEEYCTSDKFIVAGVVVYLPNTFPVTRPIAEVIEEYCTSDNFIVAGVVVYLPNTFPVERPVNKPFHKSNHLLHYHEPQSHGIDTDDIKQDSLRGIALPLTPKLRKWLSCYHRGVPLVAEVTEEYCTSDKFIVAGVVVYLPNTFPVTRPIAEVIEEYCTSDKFIVAGVIVYLPNTFPVARPSK